MPAPASHPLLPPCPPIAASTAAPTAAYCQSALVHLGLGQWDRLVADMQALDLLRPDTDK